LIGAVAAQENHPAVLRVLKSFGADLEAPNNDGATPAYIAACNGASELAANLLPRGCVF
jgi:ankyrin repeat protein